MITTTKVKKTCVSVSENTWNFLNRARGINETMEQVIIRMINIPQAQAPITDGMEDETEKINRLL
jgi:hypothetical protein